MKVGIFSRTAEQTLDGQPVRFSDIQALVVAAERVGLDSFWLPDHLIYYPPDGDPLGCWEVFSFLSALAGTTSKITLGTFVAASLFRNPTLLAKTADALDEISAGRFILGLGAGNWEREHTAFGFPFDHRAGRFEEAIQIIAPLLREEAVDFHGTYYQAPECVLRPRGPSPAGPPILVGAKGPRLLRTIARHADGYIAIWPVNPAQVTEQWDKIVAACTEIGRDPATLTLTVGTFVQLPGHGTPAGDDQAISGSYHEVATQLQALADVGVDHLIVDFRPDISVHTIEEFGRVLTLLK